MILRFDVNYPFFHDVSGFFKKWRITNLMTGGSPTLRWMWRQRIFLATFSTSHFATFATTFLRMMIKPKNFTAQNAVGFSISKPRMPESFQSFNQSPEIFFKKVRWIFFLFGIYKILMGCLFKAVDLKKDKIKIK